MEKIIILYVFHKKEGIFSKSQLWKEHCSSLVSRLLSHVSCLSFVVSYLSSVVSYLSSVVSYLSSVVSDLFSLFHWIFLVNISTNPSNLVLCLVSLSLIPSLLSSFLILFLSLSLVCLLVPACCDSSLVCSFLSLVSHDLSIYSSPSHLISPPISSLFTHMAPIRESVVSAQGNEH